MIEDGRGRRRVGALVVEGYASLFGVEDLAGDVVRAGAFARSLRRGGQVGMLLGHASGRTAGRWNLVREDGRGLFVRGMITAEAPAGVLALNMVQDGGLDGLSIGFIARDWAPRRVRGRDLREVELREISLVVSPMLPAARFTISGGGAVLDVRRAV